MYRSSGRRYSRYWNHLLTAESKNRERVNFWRPAILTPGNPPIAIRPISELRGKTERWSVRNLSLSSEMDYVDRTMVARRGLINPRGPIAKSNKPI